MKKAFAMTLLLLFLFGLTTVLAETWTCALCGKESEGNFCPYCGAKKPEEKATCPGCGAVYNPDMGYSFCQNCGTALSDSDLSDIKVTGEISDSWEQIIAAIDDGSAKRRYAIGATKELNLGKLGTVHMQLAGFELDDRADDLGEAATTWIAVELLPDEHVMNEDWEIWYKGGWRDSDLRAYLQNIVLPAIPSNIRERLIRVWKEQWVLGSDSSQLTEDRIWIPSFDEIFGNDPLYNDVFQNENKYRVKTRNGSVAWWWLRSESEEWYWDAARIVNTDGTDNSEEVSSAGGVAIGFCL